MGRTPTSYHGARKGSLTDQQRKFVTEYVKDYNGVRAAKEAGYKHPKVMAAKLLKKPDIKAEVGRHHKDNENLSILERERVLEELKVIVTRNIKDLVDEKGIVKELHELPDDIARAIDGIKVKQMFDAEGEVVGQTIEIKLVPKLPAIDLAMKHLGLYSDTKVEHSGTIHLDWDSLLGKTMQDPAFNTTEDVIEGTIANAGQFAQLKDK